MDPEQLKRRMDQLKQRSEQLNQGSNDLTRVYEHVERLLKVLNLGIDVKVPMASSGSMLVYGRNLDRKWGLWVIRKGALPIHISEASRLEKVDAVQYIPNLLDELLKQTEATILLVEDAACMAREFHAAMNKAWREIHGADPKEETGHRASHPLHRKS